jgi:hypothetical protein
MGYGLGSHVSEIDVLTRGNIHWTDQDLWEWELTVAILATSVERWKSCKDLSGGAFC